MAFVIKSLMLKSLGNKTSCKDLEKNLLLEQLTSASLYKCSRFFERRLGWQPRSSREEIIDMIESAEWKELFGIQQAELHWLLVLMAVM